MSLLDNFATALPIGITLTIAYQGLEHIRKNGVCNDATAYYATAFCFALTGSLAKLLVDDTNAANMTSISCVPGAAFFWRSANIASYKMDVAQRRVDSSLAPGSHRL